MRGEMMGVPMAKQRRVMMPMVSAFFSSLTWKEARTKLSTNALAKKPVRKKIPNWMPRGISSLIKLKKTA